MSPASTNDRWSFFATVPVEDKQMGWRLLQMSVVTKAVIHFVLLNRVRSNIG
jgi:hypothetical protein